MRTIVAAGGLIVFAQGLLGQTAAPTAELRRMLQTLLTERFKMTMHRQTKEMPVYALLAGKSGPKLKESDGSGEFILTPNKSGIKAQNASMEDLARVLMEPLKTPVQDLTGLKGRYDFAIDVREFLPRGEVSDGKEKKMAIEPAEGIAALFSAVQAQLGLKLEQRKGPVEILVIEHAEKIPVEN